jgi:hypothetical protein
MDGSLILVLLAFYRSSARLRAFLPVLPLDKPVSLTNTTVGYCIQAYFIMQQVA